MGNLTEKKETIRKVSIVVPAYNEETSLKVLLDELSYFLKNFSYNYEVVFVDDGSKDGTPEIAQRLNIYVVVHTQNLGYGANQKTCYKEALKTKATIVVMVHPDYQYDPTLLPQIIEPIKDGTAHVVFGSRMLGVSAYKQGMPWWKYVGNKFLTKLENTIFSLNLSEYHTGYRAYSREVLESIDFAGNSDGFIFDQEIVAQIVDCNFKIAEVSVPVRYFPEASSVGIAPSISYGLNILWLLCKFIMPGYGSKRQAQQLQDIS